MTDPDGAPLPSDDPLDAYEDAEDGLAFWHPVDDEEIDETYLVDAAVAPGSSADVRIRLRNQSADYAANDITVQVAGPQDPDDPSAVGEYLLSVDGETFAATAQVGDLAPGATSDAITLRRITSPDAAEGAARFLLIAAPAAWVPAAAGPTDATEPGSATGDVYDPDAAQPPVEDPEADMDPEELP